MARYLPRDLPLSSIFGITNLRPAAKSLLRARLTETESDLAPPSRSAANTSVHHTMRRHRSGARVRPRSLALVSGSALIIAFASLTALTTTSSAVGERNATIDSARLAAHDATAFSVGIPDSSEPSGQAPPTTSDIAGYQLSNVTSFSGDSVPTGWTVFSGPAAGDPGSSWATSHVVVSDDLLQLITSQEPGSTQWVSGGVCQCNVSHTYGAFFVRSRLTGNGPTQVEMLWPTSDAWPPELDFSETYGKTYAAQATLHYSSANLQIHNNIDIDMTQWHTWGVIWSPTEIIYTVDGSVWGTIKNPSVIPDVPMSLHIQTQTWCSSGMACPTTTQSTEVNWVAEYTSTAPEPIVIGSFRGNSSTMSPGVKARVRQIARVIASRGYSAVTLTGYSDSSADQASDLTVSQKLASNVKTYLHQQLALLNASGVSIVAIGAGSGGDSAVRVRTRVEIGKVFAMLK